MKLEIQSFNHALSAIVLSFTHITEKQDDKRCLTITNVTTCIGGSNHVGDRGRAKLLMKAFELITHFAQQASHIPRLLEPQRNTSHNLVTQHEMVFRNPYVTCCHASLHIYSVIMNGNRQWEQQGFMMCRIRNLHGS